ncbi:MAG: hypothetical protein PHC99_05090 [Methylococcales bacterium]|nr:hypothetical protein [Methylococcales bacterium]
MAYSLNCQYLIVIVDMVFSQIKVAESFVEINLIQTNQRSNQCVLKNAQNLYQTSLS